MTFLNMGIDDLGSKHGRERSIRKMKINAAICLGMGLIISTTFMMCYWNLFSHARSFNKAVKDLNNSAITLDDVNYDTCMNVADATSGLKLDSKWRLIFHFNAWFYTISSGITLLGFLGLFKFALFRPAACCLNCAGPVHIAAIALAGYGVFSPTGILC